MSKKHRPINLRDYEPFIQQLYMLIDSQLSEQESEQLKSELKSDPVKRQLFVDLHIKEEVLREACSAEMQTYSTPDDMDIVTCVSDVIELEEVEPGTDSSVHGSSQTALTTVEPPAVSVPARVEEDRPVGHSVVMFDFAGVQLYRGHRNTYSSGLKLNHLLAACIATAFILIGWLWYQGDGAKPMEPRVVGQLVRTFDAKWTKPVGVGSDLVTGQLELTHGFAEIELSLGTKVILEAPCQLSLDSDNQLSLNRGKLVAHVPPSAKGFTVRTDKATIVDHGTEFGVDAKTTGRTSVAVFTGRVDLSGLQAKTSDVPMRLTTGQASGVNSHGKLNRKITAVSYKTRNRFARSWEQVLYVPRVKGQARYLDTIPADLRVNRLLSNDEFYVISEQRDHVLDNDLQVGQVQTGRQKILDLPLETVAAGTVVHSYLVHVDVPKNKGNHRQLEATITFSGPVVGILATRDQLQQTDSILGAGHTRFEPSKIRATDSSVTAKTLHDYIELSPDRRTIHLEITLNKMDELRVLVQKTN